MPIAQVQQRPPGPRPASRPIFTPCRHLLDLQTTSPSCRQCDRDVHVALARPSAAELPHMDPKSIPTSNLEEEEDAAVASRDTARQSRMRMPLPLGKHGVTCRVQPCAPADLSLVPLLGTSGTITAAVAVAAAYPHTHSIPNTPSALSAHQLSIPLPPPSPSSPSPTPSLVCLWRAHNGPATPLIAVPGCRLEEQPFPEPHLGHPHGYGGHDGNLFGVGVSSWIQAIGLPGWFVRGLAAQLAAHWGVRVERHADDGTDAVFSRSQARADFVAQLGWRDDAVALVAAVLEPFEEAVGFRTHTRWMLKLQVYHMFCGWQGLGDDAGGGGAGTGAGADGRGARRPRRCR